MPFSMSDGFSVAGSCNSKVLNLWLFFFCMNREAQAAIMVSEGVFLEPEASENNTALRSIISIFWN